MIHFLPRLPIIFAWTVAAMAVSAGLRTMKQTEAEHGTEIDGAESADMAASQAQVITGDMNVKVRFLGINGFEFKSNGKTLLIDPYVSRDSTRMCIPSVVQRHIPEADYICLGHAHWDHAADVAEIARYTEAVIFGSETLLNICRHFGVPEDRLVLFENHRTVDLGPYKVTPLKSRHMEPMAYPGHYRNLPERIERASDYLEGGTWALQIEVGGFSFLNIGSANLIEEELHGIECDYLLAGISGRKPDYLPRLLKCVKAGTLIPTHWDNFLGQPLDHPGERVNMPAFHDEIKRVAPRQKVKVLQPLEMMDL